MTTSQPGADEVRVRQLLVKNGVGPDAAPPPTVPPVPKQRPRDWLDDILNDETGAPPAPEKSPKGKRRKPNPESEEHEEETSGDEDEKPAQPPAWDPVAIADRIVHAYQQRPVKERLKDAAQVVVHSRARFGQLIYTATGVWAAWRIGFTPWLLHFTADAPVGIPVFAVGLGWLVNRRLDAAPLLIAWIGRAIYTATVINLALHP